MEPNSHKPLEGAAERMIGPRSRDVFRHPLTGLDCDGTNFPEFAALAPGFNPARRWRLKANVQGGSSFCRATGKQGPSWNLGLR